MYAPRHAETTLNSELIGPDLAGAPTFAVNIPNNNDTVLTASGSVCKLEEVPIELAGTWRLVAWRRVAQDGGVSYPLGEDATGLLVYTDNGRMAVQIVAANRPEIDTGDPIGGDVDKRAAAYSGCLAYFGTYEVQDDQVVHHVEQSLYPNWSGAEQVRPLVFEDGQLVLRTPPMQTASGTVVNEIAWAREDG